MQLSWPRLEDIGVGVGLRLLEILCFREKNSKRDIRLLDVLKFVHTSLWKYLFGRQAKDLEQSNTVGEQHAIPRQLEAFFTHLPFRAVLSLAYVLCCRQRTST